MKEGFKRENMRNPNFTAQMPGHTSYDAPAYATRRWAKREIARAWSYAVTFVVVALFVGYAFGRIVGFAAGEDTGKQEVLFDGVHP